MRKDRIQKIKQEFYIKRGELKDKISNSNNQEVDADGDEIDIAAGTTLAKMQEDLSRRQLKQIEHINAALARIEDGTFGECEECGEDISEKRLLAKPEATLCILCAEKQEHQAKQFKKD